MFGYLRYSKMSKYNKTMTALLYWSPSYAT